MRFDLLQKLGKHTRDKLKKRKLLIQNIRKNLNEVLLGSIVSQRQ